MGRGPESHSKGKRWGVTATKKEGSGDARLTQGGEGQRPIYLLKYSKTEKGNFDRKGMRLCRNSGGRESILGISMQCRGDRGQ